MAYTRCPYLVHFAYGSILFDGRGGSPGTSRGPKSVVPLFCPRGLTDTNASLRYYVAVIYRFGDGDLGMEWKLRERGLEDGHDKLEVVFTASTFFPLPTTHSNAVREMTDTRLRFKELLFIHSSSYTFTIHCTQLIEHETYYPQSILLFLLSLVIARSLKD